MHQVNQGASGSRVRNPPLRLNYIQKGQQGQVTLPVSMSVKKSNLMMDDSESKVSGQKSKTTASTVVSYKTQMKLADIALNQKLMELEYEYIPKMTPLETDIKMLDYKIGNLKTEISKRDAASTDEAVVADLAKLNHDLSKCIDEHEDKQTEHQAYESQYDFYVNNVKKQVELEHQKLNILMEEEAEQALSSGDEDKVKGWDETHQSNYVNHPDGNLMNFHGQNDYSGQNFDYCYPHDSTQNVKPNVVPPQASNTAPQYGFQPRQQQQSQPCKIPYPGQGYQFYAPAQQQGTDVIQQLTDALGKAFGGGGGSTLDKELPIFTGIAEEWPVFYNEFSRTTKKYKFQESENTVRLRKSLKGAAKEAVIGLLDDPGSVNKIIEILYNRFGRSEFVIESLISKVRACKAPEVNKPETVIQFGTVVQHLVARVKSLKEDSYLNNTTLLQELVSKLPILYAEQWINWLDYNQIYRASLEHFGTWIEMKMNTMVRLCKPKLECTEDIVKQGRKRGSGTIGVTSSSQDTEKRSGCANCTKGKNSHITSKCWFFKKLNVSDRWKLAKEKKLCYCCLESDHMTKDCKDAQECEKAGCKRKHHALLHSDSREKKEVKENNNHDGSDSLPVDSKPSAMDGKDSTDTLGTVVNEGNSKPLSIVPVRVKGPKGTVRTYALMDSGANITAIDKDLAAKLGLDGELFEHNYKGVGGTKFKETAKHVNFEIRGDFYGASFYKVIDATTVNAVGIDPYTVNVDEAKGKWPYLRRAKIKSMVKAVPRIIIGEDHPYLTAHRELVERHDHEPMAKRTKLGWVLAGRKLMKTGNSSLHVYTEYNPDRLDAMIRESFSLASFGVVPRETKGSIEDARALNILEETTKLVKGKWECGLLWKEESINFPDSKPEAMTRLIQNERRMNRDKIYADMYHKKIEEYLAKEYITKLTLEETARKANRTRYIPHFGVQNVNKPGKLRLVFDAAARSEGVCLNDKLLPGPDMIQSLVSILWNFRRHNVAITGDIEDMFHRVAIRNEDRDSQRFLWRTLEEAKLGKKPDAYVMNVMIFGACSSPSSAIFVKNKNAERFRNTHPEAVRAIVEDFYVDDCLTGAISHEEAAKLREDITYINSSGGFEVKKWLSNSESVLASIPASLRANGVKDFTTKSVVPAERVLGMWWDPGEDIFTFKTNFKKVHDNILDGKCPTKREVCSLVMSVFDPVGFINHLKIKGMIILQMIWRTGIDWDDSIPDSIFRDWLEWLKCLKKIVNVKVPRVYCENIHDATSCQLHVFVDASEEAYAAVCYLRIKINSEIKVAFLSSKVRVAPLKKLTIPRLELLAAVLGSRLAVTILENLKVKVTSKHFWSDSKTVLQWIRTESLRYREFVANRVGELHDNTKSSEWKWIPTSLNVADEATRLKKAVDIEENSLWLTGPAFLKQEIEFWPKEGKVVNEDVGFDEEMKPNTVAVVNSQNEDEVKLPVAANFSSLSRLLRAIAAVFAAITHWKEKVLKKASSQPPWMINEVKFPIQGIKENNKMYDVRVKKFIRENIRSFLTLTDLEKAETYLVKATQGEAFPQEIQDLKAGKVSKNSNLRKLSPFLDETGSLRLEGRLSAGKDIPVETKQPIILPARHPFTELLIMREHIQNAHQGMNTVLNNLRRKYWILHGRASVRRVCNQCPQCRIKCAKPVIPRMGNLPHYRLTAGDPPFTYTGVDFFGPMEVTVGRHHEKRWGAVFCCMVTRAIHLEIAYGLSSDEMMLVLSRFVDVRGRPRHLFCDNGTNFVGSNKELKMAWETIDWSKITMPGQFHNIQMHFLPSFSPHMGGAWERMVQMTKKVLKRTLFEKYPKDQILLTVLKGAENMINSRPITYVSPDPSDEESLTPNHFLRGFSTVGPSIPGQYDVTNEDLRKNWKRAQSMLEHFWQRWKAEYLPELIKRQKWLEAKDPLQVGDLVLLVDDQQPRNVWVKAVITATYPGADGQVRVVEVTKRDFATKKTSVYRRSVDKVCPLGVRLGNSD